ncbi:MAG TPA: LdpA C-terminal domain-containing domain [Candidatus Obscuribacterales bacterium]
MVEAVKASFRLISDLRQNEELMVRHGMPLPTALPWLMVSFSDGDDPHFRKATFDPAQCPADCPRPCEAICPAAAIAFTPSSAGVIAERCYGCGRCLPVCPPQHIDTITRATSVGDIAPALLGQVNAVEIHTQVGRYDAFMALWQTLRPHVADLQLISISCPDAPGVVSYLWQLYEGIQPLSVPLIWQADGRPMSGDIGKGTTHATLRFAQKLLHAGPPGFVQLAGGTNAHTVSKLPSLGRGQAVVKGAIAPFSPPTFGGIAYGSFARQLLSPLLDQAPVLRADAVSTAPRSLFHQCHDAHDFETALSGLQAAVSLARGLVAPLKAGGDLPQSAFRAPWGHAFASFEALTEPPRTPI